MHNDLEKSGQNDRRRLESQVQMYEGQAQDLRIQLTQERDTAQVLSKTRETLIGAETSKTHLEQRVEELSRQLQGNDEKLAVYERRSSSVAGVSQHMDQDLTREQQLEAEVADLRSSLKVAEVDLATARSHVQQFREISQANEAALKSLDATYDDYKTSTEAQIARHQVCCMISPPRHAADDLLQVGQELAQFTAKTNELQKSFETERTAWLNDKKVLEDTIVDLGTSEKHSESDRTSRENEVRQLEQRAKVAEERSEQAVLAHAESIKAITSLKQQLSTTQATARDHQTAAETAFAKLSASESSWALQKDALDKEVSDLNRRCQDLTSQNSLLHQHLESVSSQAARIRQAAESSTSASGEGESTDDTDTKLAELRSVVAYLRKEKEIVDLQLELSKQECARLKTQIDHLSQTLDDTRATLSDERERAVETAASAAQHAELVERINQLNILRESNATLRAESENHQKRSKELEAKLKQLSAQLNPAKEQARVAQAELEARNSQMARLEEENRKWQERNTQLLSKYDRIDPAEVQALKDQIEQLRAQLVGAETDKEEKEKAFQTQQQHVRGVLLGRWLDPHRRLRSKRWKKSPDLQRGTQQKQ
ncbi:TPR/MLP1/MLP2-like protein-domain-containing protein [Mycena galopus ATCC 62051]|nr:TPR/MLP1/MLP2-like protein-domain-containing protein [Mycena galopus ATCC 62051]